MTISWQEVVKVNEIDEVRKWWWSYFSRRRRRWWKKLRGKRENTKCPNMWRRGRRRWPKQRADDDDDDDDDDIKVLPDTILLQTGKQLLHSCYLWTLFLKVSISETPAASSDQLQFCVQQVNITDAANKPSYNQEDSPLYLTLAPFLMKHIHTCQTLLCVIQPVCVSYQYVCSVWEIQLIKLCRRRRSETCCSGRSWQTKGAASGLIISNSNSGSFLLGQKKISEKYLNAIHSFFSLLKLWCKTRHVSYICKIPTFIWKRCGWNQINPLFRC